MVPITVEDEVSCTNKYSLIATINHSGTLNRGHYWVLSRTYTHLLGTLAMTNWFSMLKKGLSTILHHTSFFTEKFECAPGSTKKKFFEVFFSLQRGFVISDIVFGCDCPTYNPSPVWELTLITQFWGFTTLRSLVLEKHCKGARSCMVLSMRSDDVMYNPCPSTS